MVVTSDSQPCSKRVLRILQLLLLQQLQYEQIVRESDLHKENAATNAVAAAAAAAAHLLEQVVQAIFRFALLVRARFQSIPVEVVVAIRGARSVQQQ